MTDCVGDQPRRKNMKNKNCYLSVTDQGLREELCYPVAVTRPRAFHLTRLAALQPAGPEAQPSTSIICGYLAEPILSLLLA
ncbi:hypothetical protein EYF80_017110 [Liparis tanakae]|uniref:Uncharacterized protein n=1 Tax=Liparis tanakae TaxID=230148 RepID=A0A4Z2I4G4_9TELE|nr:hypothetical protein EYF80_017110 [Liparis tanakae]